MESECNRIQMNPLHCITPLAHKLKLHFQSYFEFDIALILFDQYCWITIVDKRLFTDLVKARLLKYFCGI